ncbi:sigma-70 family RNA polymerase sigma factor [Labrys sp. La1]|uniref:sigma-70 family RNA polymerase sigma factor n=1 Tax=Labrys sp. La1 TaxID=3404917 RepID=UPI003EBDBFBE
MTAHAGTNPDTPWLLPSIRRLAAWWHGVWAMAATGQPSARAAGNAETLARFQAVILPHLDAAHNLARYLCRDADIAEDIVQEAFLRAFRGFADYRGGSARAWLLTIVRNCHRSWWQARQRSIHTEPLDDGEGGEERTDLPHDEASPEATLLQGAEAGEIREVLDGLPEVFREILVLREMEDLSYREIADTIVAPMGTVMSRLARARALFAAAWKSRQAGLGEEA